MRAWLVIAIVVVTLLPLPASAQVACEFKLGFKALRDQIPTIVGACLENERFNPANGHTEQKTAGGLLVWRKADNFTAFTDGHQTWVNGPRGLQSRLNTESFPWESGGAPPPPGRRTPSGYEIPTTYFLPTVPAPRPDSLLPCLKANPSCERDPWWVEWNENQDDALVQFAFVGPGLVSEARFIEAVWLLWQWPEGKALLGATADHGVMILADEGDSAFAFYRERERLIAVDHAFLEVSTWMLADLLAHELRHAADHQSGLRTAATYTDCIQREQAAYQTEWRFLGWLSQRFGNLPDRQSVASRLSREDFSLYMNLYTIGTSRDLNVQAIEDYRKTCSVFLRR